MPLDAVQIESLRYTYARNPFTLEKSDLGVWQVFDKPLHFDVTGTTNDQHVPAVLGQRLRRTVDAADKRAGGVDQPQPGRLESGPLAVADSMSRDHDSRSTR